MSLMHRCRLARPLALALISAGCMSPVAIMAKDTHCDPLRALGCSLEDGVRLPVATFQAVPLSVAVSPASAATTLAAGRSMAAAWAGPADEEAMPAADKAQRDGLDREWAEAVNTSASATGGSSDSPLLPFLLATLSIVVFVAHRRSGG